jgi:hypothetical protein
VGQWAYNDQSADSAAESVQKGACNINSPVRIKSDGDDGDVSQSNSSDAESAAGNDNETKQSADQSAGSGYGDAAVQAIGQWADNAQDASSDATSEQYYPSNVNAPVWLYSYGGGGSVEQSNDSDAASAAGNRNSTCQRAQQGQGTGSYCGRKERKPLAFRKVSWGAGWPRRPVLGGPAGGPPLHDVVGCNRAPVRSHDGCVTGGPGVPSPDQGPGGNGGNTLGARPHLRWVAIAATLWLAAVPAAALAQSPPRPDAAPGSASSSPSPDPTPSAARKPVIKRTIQPARIAAPTSAPPTQTTTATPSVTTPAKPAVRRATTRHRKRPVQHKREKPAPATKHRAVVAPPALPRLSPAQLVAHTSGNDDGRARKLAAGALSLLLLALASAMLLAVTARVERRKVVR